MGVAYKPKTHFSTLLDNCVMIPVFQDGSLPFWQTHKHSSVLEQALCTQIANHHIQWARNSFKDFFSKFRPATRKFRQAAAKGHIPHQTDLPPLLIPVATMENVNKAMDFNSATRVTWSWTHWSKLQDFPTINMPPFLWFMPLWVWSGDYLCSWSWLYTF